jgi:protein-S-isoprenylcysteine O-methyltransferase Ste14
MAAGMTRWLEHRVPPPIVAACTAALMLGAAWALPAFHIEVPWAAAIGGAFAAIGLAVAAAGVLEFLRARTTVNPLDPAAASALVVRGIYKRTRNPMYQAFGLFVLGLAFAFASDWTFLLFPLGAAVMHFGVVRREERYLEGKFGEAWRSYSDHVPRYGWPI